MHVSYTPKVCTLLSPVRVILVEYVVTPCNLSLIIYSPSGYVFRVVTLERHVVIHGTGRTASILRGDAVPTDVELLTVVGVRECWMG